MATVTGYTAARMKQIEDETVVDGEIVDGNLILTRRNGDLIDAGGVAGPKGDKGDKGDPGDEFNLAGYVEPVNNLGAVSGALDLDLSSFNVWRIDPTGDVELSFSNLPSSSEIAPMTLIVANGDHAIIWPAGTRFSGGSAPVIDGETWLSMAALGSTITVGVAWSGVEVDT